MKDLFKRGLTVLLAPFVGLTYFVGLPFITIGGGIVIGIQALVKKIEARKTIENDDKPKGKVKE